MQIGDTYTRGSKTWRVVAIDGERVTCQRVVDDGLPMLAETAIFAPRELTEGSLLGQVKTDAEAIAMIRRDVPDEEIDGAIAFYREMMKTFTGIEPWQALWVMADMAKESDDA